MLKPLSFRAKFTQEEIQSWEKAVVRKEYVS